MSSIHERDFQLKHLAVSNVLLCFKVGCFFLTFASYPINTQIWTEIFLERATISATKPMLTLQCSLCVTRAITFEPLNLVFSISKKSFHEKEHKIFTPKGKK